MSEKPAAPVAKHGEPILLLDVPQCSMSYVNNSPNHPRRNRSTRSPPIFWTKAVGINKMTKMKNVMI